MKSPKILRLLFLLILLIAGLVALSQPKQPMIWIEGVQTIQFTKKFSTMLLFQRRVFLEKETTYQHIYWISGNFKLKQNISVGGGLMYFTYHKKVGDRYASVPEIRPFQYLTFTQKIGKVKLTLRNMIEERYLSDIVGNDIRTAGKFNTRYRFRLRGIIPIAKSLHLELSNELLFNGKYLPKDTFDQNRAVGRLRYKIKSWSLNGGYMHWLVNASKGREHRPAMLIGVSHKFSKI